MCCLTCEAAIDNDVKCMECLLREGKSCDYSLVIAAREGFGMGIDQGWDCWGDTRGAD